MNAWGIKVITKIIFFAFVCLVTGCGKSLCENKLLHEIASPQNDYIVSVFERDCGATTPVVSVVSLRNKENLLDMEKYDNWVFTAHGGATIKTAWVEDKKLLINYLTTDGAPTKKLLWDNVSVVYESK